MPGVEVVIQARIHAVEHDSSIGLGETERLPMTFVVVLLPALGQQHFRDAEILAETKRILKAQHSIQPTESVEI